MTAGLKSLVCSLVVMSAAGQSPTRIPAVFVPNHGQAPPHILFTAAADSLQALFEPSRVWLGTGRGWIAKELEGASTASTIVPLEAVPGVVNYLNGSRRAVGIAPYSGISYRDIYGGIHMDYKAANGRLKSEFVVAPRVDPRVILISYPDSELSIAPDGSLLASRGEVTLREEPPIAFQIVGNQRVLVQARYKLTASGSVAFELGRYDATRELIIDPVLTYSTYLGGSRADAATSVAMDSTGAVYVAGWTDSTDLQPNTTPLLRGSGVDTFVLKVNAGGELVFLTILGGSAEDKALGIAVDGTGGNIWVTGSTTSANFPVTLAGNPLRGPMDAFLLRLTPDGRQLAFSGLYGGDQSEIGYGVALDATGNAYIAGETTSNNLPVVPTGTSVFRGQVDGFVVKVTASGTMAYSRYLGGTQTDQIRAIAVDASGRAYITGRTTSADFPLVTPLQVAMRGSMDAFVTKLDATGTVLLYSTFIGGGSGLDLYPEEGTGIAVDSSGRAFVVGTTPSADFPVVSAAQAQYGGGSLDAFVVGLSAAGQALIFGTFIGGSSLDYGTALALDANGIIYFAGYSASSDLPVTATFGPGGSFDAIAGSLTSAGVKTSVVRIGGTGDESGMGIAAGWMESTTIVGSVASLNLPLKDAIQTQNVGGLGAFISRITETRPPQIAPFTPLNITGTTSAMLSLQVTDANGWTDIVSIQWRIGTACEIRYTRASNTFQLLNDAGATYQGSLTSGTNSTIANSQCQVNGINTIVAGSNSTLAVQLHVTLLPAYTGSKAVYVESSDGAASTGWQSVGTWLPSGAPAGLGFNVLPPCRIADTRADQHKTGAFGPPRLSPYVTRNFPIPSSSCGVPSSARVFSFNVTAVPTGPLDFLSTWSAGVPFPGISTLNSPGGLVLANAAVVPAGSDGSIAVVGGQSTDLLIDVNGYFAAPQTGDLLFYPLPPCRVSDTRTTQGKTGAWGPPSLAAYATRDIPLRNTCGVPVTAQAYMLNVTAVPKGQLDFISIWPAGQGYPGVSTLNSVDGSVLANAAIVPAGVNGNITVVSGNPTDLVLDISGYFGPSTGTGGLRLYPLNSCRIMDTRGYGKTGGFGPPHLPAYSTRTVAVRSSGCNVPPEAQAYSLNITAVPMGPLDFLSVWPAGQPYPGVSTLNSPSGRVIANAATVPAGLNGAIHLVSGNPTEVIIDINGYFAP
jgi:hypothetical protein